MKQTEEDTQPSPRARVCGQPAMPVPGWEALWLSSTLGEGHLHRLRGSVQSPAAVSTGSGGQLLKQTAPALVSSMLHKRPQPGGQDGLRVRELIRVRGDAGRREVSSGATRVWPCLESPCSYCRHLSKGQSLGGDRGDLGRADSRAPPPRCP